MSKLQIQRNADGNVLVVDQETGSSEVLEGIDHAASDGGTDRVIELTDDSDETSRHRYAPEI